MHSVHQVLVKKLRLQQSVKAGDVEVGVAQMVAQQVQWQHGGLIQFWQKLADFRNIWWLAHDRFTGVISDINHRFTRVICVMKTHLHWED